MTILEKLRSLDITALSDRDTDALAGQLAGRGQPDEKCSIEWTGNDRLLARLVVTLLELRNEVPKSTRQP